MPVNNGNIDRVRGMNRACADELSESFVLHKTRYLNEVTGVSEPAFLTDLRLDHYVHVRTSLQQNKQKTKSGKGT